MRKIIINLIDAVIIPKYGNLSYSVVGTNHFPNMNMGDSGYSITYTKVPKKIQQELGKDTQTIFRMLGFDRVGLSIIRGEVLVGGIDTRDNK